MTAPAWMANANCIGADPSLFFSDDDRPAKKICAGCEVVPECLNYALELDIKDGVWGSSNASERKRIRRKQRAA